MTSLYAKSLGDTAPPRHVVFVIYPDIVLLDLVGPLQVFTHAQTYQGSGPAYKTAVVSEAGGQVATNTVLPIGSDPIANWVSADAPAIHTLVVIGGDGAVPASRDRHITDLVRQLADCATRVSSVCSGALVLAAAGLLDGRRAVTHWEDCDALEQGYPKVQVEVDPIFIKDGHVWTSAGITAGIDMALAMVEEDLGKASAMAMARSLVTPMVRSGGQSQFSQALHQQSRDVGGRFAQLHAWIAENLHRTVRVEDMAEVCNMSGRSFSRRYTATMGQSPAKALEVLRVERGRDLLATTDNSIQTIAVDCGFFDDERMRRAFLRHLNTSPSMYRKQFQP